MIHIVFDKVNKAFQLGGKSVSYAMFVGDAWHLQSLYYGAKISVVRHIGSIGNGR